jgi:thiol-disulfide isomerase/thioredoxin
MPSASLPVRTAKTIHTVMFFRTSIVFAAVLALVACQKPQQQFAPVNGSSAASAGGPVKGVDRSHKGAAMAKDAFDDPNGKETILAKFSGKPLLVNLWATWCAPCVKELPTLDHLALSHEKDGSLQVLAVSQDFGPHASVEAFLKKNNIRKLFAYQDAKSSLSLGLGAEVLPTSILFDAKGREVWRYVGDLDWTSPEAAKLLSEAGVPQPR